MSLLPRSLKRFTAAAALGLSLLTYAAPARAQQITSVTNGASFEQKLAPSSMATVFGKDLSDKEHHLTGFPIPEKMGETSISIGGMPQKLLYAGPGQVNFQIDNRIVPGEHTLRLTRGTKTADYQIKIDESAPGTFTFLDKLAITQDNSDYSLIAPSGIGKAAKPGDILITYGTGFGNAVPTPQGHRQVHGTQAYLIKPNGGASAINTLGTYEAPGLISFSNSAIPIPTFGTFETAGFLGLNQTAYQLPDDLETGVHKVVICKGEACTQETAIPVWDGKSRYVNTILMDVDNNYKLLGHDNLKITNTNTGDERWIVPQNSMYVGNAPNAEEGQNLEFKIQSGTHYHWTRNSKAADEKNLIKAYVPMMERFADDENIDPATGQKLDSLDFLKFMNQVNVRETACGKPFFYTAGTHAKDIYFVDEDKLPPHIIAYHDKFVTEVEKSWGYQPGTHFRRTTEDPLLTGRDGVRIRWGMGHTGTVTLKEDSCGGPRLMEIRIAGTPSVEELSDANIQEIGIILGAHEDGHAGGLTNHSPYEKHNMWYGVSGRPKIFEQKTRHRLDKIPLYTNSAEYSK